MSIYANTPARPARSAARRRTIQSLLGGSPSPPSVVRAAPVRPTGQIRDLVNQPLADTVQGAQGQLRNLNFELSKLGTIEGRAETQQSNLLTRAIEGLKNVFPGISLSADYSLPAEAADTERAATLSEIKALADSIPISSIGPQGSNPPSMLTDSGSVSTTNNKTLLGIALAGVVLVIAFVFFVKR